MEMEGMKCPGCGSSHVEFDPKRRILRCYQCGKEEYYSRATLNASGKVVFAKQNAVRFFKEGKLEDSRHYAMDVLNISSDNAPAMFMLAYYDEFTARKSDAMKRFFHQIQEIPLEYEEVKELRELILAAAYNLGDFEEDIIQLIATNMQAAEDAKDLCDFIDTFCPYQIARHTSSGFLTPNLSDMYQQLSNHCGIPKTCFALLKSIETNPDSPYTDQSFYLKAKVRHFYEHYIAEVGKVISAMEPAALKNKFLGAYQLKCKQYKKDAGLM